ncbi:hypothetical protein roselon_00619 [Roseibacterium elongatum DSM 19469]|uniref:Sulphotransferase Stf0 domain-containing protein n=1 Tax=Roseicyclus elongatus DSM 19469 TaxID=1294273 RepID=W8RPU6_9RHOB|nr:Stf0 family sulfotransferase [Roseibacterium elongatum]AHM03058.1 hypothetical protein roselon_00619 [Roseibacterium elongatum DSM 19469]
MGEQVGGTIEDYFTRSQENPARREKIQARPLPTRKLVIYFTPRSGSSWLTDLIGQSRHLGAGNEVFNPNFTPQIANGIQALGRDDYILQVQKWFCSPNGVFSFEVTAHQLGRLFPDPTPFMDTFNDASCVPLWLIRRDIVAQGVSLAKMVRTKIAHSPETDGQDDRKLDSGFDYDADEIKRWITHILNAERRNEALFQDYGIAPFRLCYEDMMHAGPEAVRRRLAELAQLRDPGWPELTLRHEKLGTSQNRAYADRFRKDRADLVAKIEAERAPMLARLQAI